MPAFLRLYFAAGVQCELMRIVFFFCGFASLISALSAFFLCFSVSLLFSFLFFSACESNSKGSMLIVLARQKMRWHFVARHDEFDTGLSKSNGHFVAKE